MAFPNQTYFYCKSKSHKNVEVAMKVAESKLQAIGNSDNLVIVTFRCPQCGHELIYKISGSDMNQFLPLGQKPKLNYSR